MQNRLELVLPPIKASIAVDIKQVFPAKINALYSNAINPYIFGINYQGFYLINVEIPYFIPKFFPQRNFGDLARFCLHILPNGNLVSVSYSGYLNSETENLVEINLWDMQHINKKNPTLIKNIKWQVSIDESHFSHLKIFAKDNTVAIVGWGKHDGKRYLFDDKNYPVVFLRCLNIENNNIIADKAFMTDSSLLLPNNTVLSTRQDWKFIAENTLLINCGHSLRIYQIDFQAENFFRHTQSVPIPFMSVDDLIVSPDAKKSVITSSLAVSTFGACYRYSSAAFLNIDAKSNFKLESSTPLPELPVVKAMTWFNGYVYNYSNPDNPAWITSSVRDWRDHKNLGEFYTAESYDNGFDNVLSDGRSISLESHKTQLVISAAPFQYAEDINSLLNERLNVPDLCKITTSYLALFTRNNLVPLSLSFFAPKAEPSIPVQSTPDHSDKCCVIA